MTFEVRIHPTIEQIDALDELGLGAISMHVSIGMIWRQKEGRKRFEYNLQIQQPRRCTQSAQFCAFNNWTDALESARFLEVS
jgi:hypothetical protein